jgi:L-aminoadipate-semialdehyde dehydrogenase
MLSGIAHDPIQRDIFTPIFFGATIHVPDGKLPTMGLRNASSCLDAAMRAAEDIMSPGALARWVAEHEAGAPGRHLAELILLLLLLSFLTLAVEQVTVTHLTPAMGQLLTANATTEMPSLRVALFVGDVLTKWGRQGSMALPFTA